MKSQQSAPKNPLTENSVTNGANEPNLINTGKALIKLTGVETGNRIQVEGVDSGIAARIPGLKHNRSGQEELTAIAKRNHWDIVFTGDCVTFVDPNRNKTRVYEELIKAAQNQQPKKSPQASR